ncbi:hypothetical protein N2603_39610 [Bradyrhizobium huanghuaihaiense]|uniref:hypothetical protein n=1 Tax=Bradyrhizobium huanghuaihaiense TaxID=990078 RepID=UPI0021A97A95|nr:hypothetical protein N2603_39610 [Bradyrhizobium sp. CB3035]
MRRLKDDQHREWQKAVAGGAIIGLVATELETPRGGNVRPNTTLTADGDDLLLNGTKYYSTGTLYSDYVLVRAADTSGATAATLIPVNRDGIELLDDWDGLGQPLDGDQHHAFPKRPGQAPGGGVRCARRLRHPPTPIHSRSFS